MSLIVVVGAGFALFAFALISARRQHPHARRARHDPDAARAGAHRARRHARARRGADAGGIPVPRAGSSSSLAVWAAMRAFQINEPLVAAGLVLVLMNVATIFPLWPGNVGLVQAAVALPLVAVRRRLRAWVRVRDRAPGDRGVASGSGSGSIFLAREGLSYATLKEMPDEARRGRRDGRARRGADRERSRLPG